MLMEGSFCTIPKRNEKNTKQGKKKTRHKNSGNQTGFKVIVMSPARHTGTATICIMQAIHYFPPTSMHHYAVCVCVSYANETSGCEARKLLRNKSHSHHKLNNNKGNRQTRGTPCHPSTIRRFMSSISPSVRPSVIHHPFIHQQSINQPSTHPSSCLIQTHSTSQPTTDPSTRRKIMSSA